MSHKSAKAIWTGYEVEVDGFWAELSFEMVDVFAEGSAGSGVVVFDGIGWPIKKFGGKRISKPRNALDHEEDIASFFTKAIWNMKRCGK